MRGYRLAARRVFEVDQPSVQARKREKLAAIPSLPDREVHYVPVDFGTQCLEEELVKAKDVRHVTHMARRASEQMCRPW